MTLIRMCKAEYQFPAWRDEFSDVYFFLQQVSGGYGLIIGKVPRALKMASGYSFTRRCFMLETFKIL